MIKKLLLAIAVLIAAVLAFATTRPDSFRIERSMLVQAPPQAVYPQIADFRRWQAWSPYENLDPAMKRRYALQAAIAACHARAATAEDTDWERIAALYDALSQLAPSPVVELNRAVAVAMAFGPAEGLALADRLLEEPLMAQYHLLPSVRGDFLFKLGRHGEARAEFERAAGLTRNLRERRFLLARAAACDDALPR